MTTTTYKARNEYTIAINSLDMAEGLLNLLESNILSGNDYYNDALRNAMNLVDEMQRNLQDVMDRFTPEQCGL